MGGFNRSIQEPSQKEDAVHRSCLNRGLLCIRGFFLYLGSGFFLSLFSGLQDDRMSAGLVGIW